MKALSKMAEQKLHVVRLRDDFYRDGYTKIMLVLFVSMTAVGLLIAVSAYLFLSKPLPVQFATDNEWRVIGPVPVDKPYLSSANLLQWVSEVFPNVFNYDFVHYNENLEADKHYFTDNGWDKFLGVIGEYASYNTIQDSKLFMHASAATAPIILNQGLLDGRYAWWVQMSLHLDYTSAEKREGKDIQLQVLVTRIPTLNNLDGVSIDNVAIVKPTTTGR